MLQKIQIENYPGAEEGWKYFEQVETPAGWIKLGEHQQYDISVRGPSFILHGGGGQKFCCGQIISSFQPGSAALKFQILLHVYLFQAESARNYLFKKTTAPPPP